MRRRFDGVLILLAVCALTAQTTALAQSTSTQPAPTPIALGQSVIPLYGPWKFQTGDSPIDPKTGQPLWAEPDFDDSKWEAVDLKPPTETFDPANPSAMRVPGWHSKGHSTYSGWAWYRLAVQLPADHPSLALAGPAHVDGAYQVFSDGRLLGSMGDFDKPGASPTIYWSHPALFALPQTSYIGGSVTHRTPQVLAFRVWSPSSFNFPEQGGLHAPPLLGEAGSVNAEFRLEWTARFRDCGYSLFEALVLFLLAAAAASLIVFDRSDPIYPTVAAVLLVNASLDVAFSLANLTTLLSLTTYQVLLGCVFLPLMIGGWTLVWWLWFRLTRPAWLPWAIGPLIVAYSAAQAIEAALLIGAAPDSFLVIANLASVVVRLLFLPLMVLIVALGIRKQGREGWLIVPAFVPLLVGQFEDELAALHIPTHWTPFGSVIFLGQIGIDLSAVAISILLLRRLLISVRRQRQMALDVKQAQEVQQVILPEARLVLPGLPGQPGLTIESEYRPAREVGGDFFQIIPHKTDGSLLIVAGDVTGKGLKAGMLVALLVGAIRSTLDWTADPMAVLQALNKRVLGRADAQATCLALRIDPAGTVILTNAGHMPPYLNGEPLAMEGALPLGMSAAAEFSDMHFQLNVGDRLVLLSDGIAEATDENGQLFGFDRVHSLLRSATTAAEIAVAAQAFGQEDDISVIFVTRAAAAEQALA